MNIASLLKSNEKKYLLKSVTGRSAVWCAEKPKSSESILVDRLPSAVTARPDINDRDLTRNLLWVDMITNALIVIVISSVSYFFIPAKIVGPIKAAAVTSNSEPSQSR